MCDNYLALSYFDLLLFTNIAILYVFYFLYTEEKKPLDYQFLN